MRTVGWNLTSLLASGSIDDIDGVIVRRKKAIAGGIVGDVIPATITANRVLGEPACKVEPTLPAKRLSKSTMRKLQTRESLLIGTF